MIRAIRINEFGGPDTLQWEDVELTGPAAGEIQIRHEAVGLNMVDTYYRTGLYPLELPSGLGSEAAGQVSAIGSDVDGFAVGDRVAYASPPPLDAYSEARNIDARWVVKLPVDIPADVGAAIMLKGLTSWYLLHRSYRVQPGDWVLLYAAAGGVGLIAAQWARSLGARVIGVVGSESKRALASANGCEAVLLAADDVVAGVRELTKGEGVAAVYDSIGKDTFWQSLDCLRRHGYMVSFGNASGPVEPFAPLELAKRGSLYVTRPTLYDFIGSRDELEAGSGALFDAVTAGSVEITIGQRFALSDAALAQQALERRETTGCTVLLP